MKMKPNKFLIYITILCLLLFVVGEAKQPNIELVGKVKLYEEISNKTSINDNFSPQENDIIVIAEPYKSIIQKGAKFAIAQTEIANHVNPDTAMNIFNEVALMLSKKSRLYRMIKVLSITMGTILLSGFFFPGIYKRLEKTWRDPTSIINLDKYMKSNGILEKSVISSLSSQTDDTLNRIGLHDNTCRQKSLCYLGEAIRCLFPQSSEAIIKFSSENLSNTLFKENKYFDSFVSGFKDQNCTNVDTVEQTGHCLGNIFNSVIQPKYQDRQKNKYQTIQASRA